METTVDLLGYLFHALGLLGLAILLAACGAIATPAPTVAPTATPVPHYRGQDALDAWHEHGLEADIIPGGGTPPATLVAAYLVRLPLPGRVMLLFVAESPQAARAYVAKGSGGSVKLEHYVAANLILYYLPGDQAYAQALDTIP